MFSFTVPESGDPFSSIADAYLADIRCPRTYRDAPGNEEKRDYERDLEHRFGYLGEFIEGWGVDAVVLLGIKYCDSHGYYLLHIRHYLEKLGIPSLYIEHDYTGGTPEQVKNRVGAFIEMLKG